ncbi:hypothetical protein CBOM_08145 [Ceraceosorus bombacis]|uniref:Uncharacterized protein n=1 Tax=Ceraceosorus bombacis TaxID=401625 RepID=A0A0P1BA16_9BASI|nr:hypothetical protein CBOM_08145 [Ceraceosorus bombacis]
MATHRLTTDLYAPITLTSCQIKVSRSRFRACVAGQKLYSMEVTTPATLAAMVYLYSSLLQNERSNPPSNASGVKR